LLRGLKQAFIGCGNVKALSDDANVTLFVLMIAIPTVMIFSAINAAYGHWMLSALEVTVALILSPFLWFGRKGVLLPYFRYVPIVAAYITFSFLFVTGGIGNLGIYWTLIFPFLAFLLMGVRQGWLWIGLNNGQYFFLATYRRGRNGWNCSCRGDRRECSCQHQQRFKPT